MESIIKPNQKVKIIDKDCEYYGRMAITVDKYRHERDCVCVLLYPVIEDVHHPDFGAIFFPLSDLRYRKTSLN